MTGRSLRMSEQGIARAKRALVRKSLTQKAIVNELGIASWSTVSKFFNGKPVDRLLFMEICHALELDWSEVVATPELEEEEEAPANGQETRNEPISPSVTDEHQEPPLDLIDTVRAQAVIARDALTPRILERIPREVVRLKYLPAINRGVVDGRPRIIGITGPAGYGKSTILGDLYDELIAAEVGWVGLILCSSLSLSTDFLSYTSYSIVASTFAPSMGGSVSNSPTESQGVMLETGFGNALCDQSRSVVDVVSELTRRAGRGVILIDTLDLVANRSFILSFSKILRELVGAGATVVFTCRDREYSDYLEPTRECLPGLSHALDRYTVPNFSTAEIRLAADTFFRTHDLLAEGQGQTFADNILNLSADNRSLQEIIENPLLLALLCDLFAAEGNVPPDLTVSKLYQRYWQEKVAYTRLDRRDAALLAMEKETLCLAIARRLFELSEDRLCESIYRDELEVAFNTLTVDAYNDLLSEGVLTVLPSGKVHFFHQTLLEYAIAYGLTRQSARDQRQQLFMALNQSETSVDRTYWLPVVRQLLTIVDSDVDFEQWVQQLNTEDLGIFATVCMAAASRDSPAALRQLLPTALELGEVYQKQLRAAFNVASRQLIEQLWDVLLLLLEQGPHATAANTAQLVGELLARWWWPLRQRLSEAMGAIACRQIDPSAPAPFHQEGDWALLSGWLLQPCLEVMAESVEPELLTALQSYWLCFGHRTATALLDLHCGSGVPLEEQWNFLATLLQEPVPDYDDVGRALARWIAYLLEQTDPMAPTPLGIGWMEQLHQSFPSRWDKVQAAAIGRWAANQPTQLRALLQDLINGPAVRIQRNLHALITSVEHGGGADLVHRLLMLPSGTAATSANLNALSKLLTCCVSEVSSEQQAALVSWLAPALPQSINQLHWVIDALAEPVPAARTLLIQSLPSCPPKKQREIRNRLLRFQPIAEHPPLHTLDKATQRYLMDLYRQQASGDRFARERILIAAQAPRRDMAVAASHDLVEVMGEALTVADSLSLLRSPFSGVQANGLNALITQMRQSQLPTVEEMEQLCQVVLEATNQTVIRLFMDSVAGWGCHNQPAPPSLLKCLSSLPSRLIEMQQFEGGTARSLLDALKALAQSNCPPDRGGLLRATEDLLMMISLVHLLNGESEMIDLLGAIHRLDASFLGRIVQDCGATLVQREWFRNLAAVVKAIERVEGQNSPQLASILAADWCTPRVHQLILEARLR